MNLNSRLFDRIRVKSAPQAAEPVLTPCNHPGCKAEGVFRAPMGRDREGQYFSFCMDHVREYNATYDYFRGMNDEALAKFQKDDIVGHRPTWPLGAKRGARGGPEHSDETIFGEARVYRRRGAGRSGKYKHEPRYNALALKALADARTRRPRRRGGHQGALQGAGETPPPRRQWRRPLVGRKIARDHSGL